MTRLVAAALLLGALQANAVAAPRDARVPGGVAVIAVGSAATPRPQARFADRPVLVERLNGQWQAFVGLPLDLVPGRQTLAVDGRPIDFTVGEKTYPVQQVTLKDHGKVELSPENAARADAEIAEIRQLKQHWRAAAAIDLDFVLPADGARSGRFGARRVFNGQPRAPHSGLDIALPRGAPVRASAAGEVLAIGDYFFNGRTLFIDHGNGLISMFCHLERIDVARGDPVRRGQVVGAAGSSGRASGPHLHWSVVLNAATVDPELFVASAPARRQR